MSGTRKGPTQGRLPQATVTAVLVALLAACAASPASSLDPADRGTGGPGGTVTVLAAASLTESFDRLKQDFEAARPGVTVELSFGSSATLVQQVSNGAPASAIALAGTSAAEPLDKSLIRDEQVFATNTLEIAVPPGNPGGVSSIDDLAKPAVKVVVCADTVPCGKAAQATFAKAGIVPNLVSKEVDVKATLAKVTLGEADAAVVYHTDVVAAKDAVKGVHIGAHDNTTISYPVIRLSDDAPTKAFLAYLLSRRGLATVQSFGFGPP